MRKSKIEEGKMNKKAQELKMLEKILNLPSIMIKAYHEFEGIGWIFEVESSGKKSICPRCGQTSEHLHKNHGHLVKDLPICGKTTYLKVNRRQYFCPECKKTFSEEFSWLRKRRSYTSRLGLNILEQLKKNNIKTVSEMNNVSEEEIEKMLEDVKEEINNKEIKNVKRMGIDEIATEKGKHNYRAVLVDLDTKEPLRILAKRTKEVVKAELESWEKEVLENIIEVSIDLWRGYETVVKELMPNVEIVADRFHVMKQVNDELDQARKSERRKVNKMKNKKEKQKKLKVITNSKYILLKNNVDLKAEEKEKLKEVEKNYPNLKKMYSEKERFRSIYEQSKNWQEGLFKIGDWLKKAQNLFPKSSQTIKNWIGEIISYFDHRTTNGVLEGINNKLKLIQRTAYGFRNFDNFCTRVFLNWHFQC
jgi:transposase